MFPYEEAVLFYTIPNNGHSQVRFTMIDGVTVANKPFSLGTECYRM